jgi:hypothetical protein
MNQQGSLTDAPSGVPENSQSPEDAKAGKPLVNNIQEQEE